MSDVVVQHPAEATKVARDRWRSRGASWHYLCLRQVREDLGIASRYASAIDAWDAATHKVATSDPKKVPFGAPYFSNRPGSEFGHIMLAGGRFPPGWGYPAGERILWTTDEHGDGRISPVTFDFIRLHWGHTLQGFTRDLNGTDIPYLLDGVGR